MDKSTSLSPSDPLVPTRRSRDSSLRIVVLGYIVRCPVGGLAWHHLQYVSGLAQLGHDVYFVEDSDDYPSCYDPSRNVFDTDPSYGLQFISVAFERLGIGPRWAYYDGHRRTWFGPASRKLSELFREADLLLNVSGVNPIRPWLQSIPVRAFVDTDPVFVQVRHMQNQDSRTLAQQHNAFFTFGENVSKLRRVADDGFPWHPTRQPIVLDAWPVMPPRPDGFFTTVMNWDSYPPVVLGGECYGMKSASFDPYYNLPELVRETFEIAMVHCPPKLQEAGWKIAHSLTVTRDPWTYQDYLQHSKAEFTVAKHGYVKAGSGWFSERTACYLASGRPAVVQDTGFTDWLQTDCGVIAFKDLEGAISGVEEIARNLKRHCDYARQIADEYFDARKVLTELVDTALSAKANPLAVLSS
jgi:hypothetical protein